MSEKEYRSLRERVSYSDYKLLDNDREKFYKERILGEKKIEKKSQSLLIGDLVHTELSGIDGAFEEKFYLTNAIRPTGQVGDLCDKLVERTIRTLSENEFGEKIQNSTFETIFEDALQAVQYNYKGEIVAFKEKGGAKSKEKVLEMFQETGELYYKECINNLDRQVVTVADIEKAEKLAKKVRENQFTGKYTVNEHVDCDIFCELPILFEIDSIPHRSMPDRIQVNHAEKKVTPIDFKTNWDAENPESSYLKNSYYLQLGLYNYAITEWMKENGLENYTLEPMYFLYIDTSGWNDPVILKPSKDDVERAWRGFIVRSYRYNGLTELINQLRFHLDTGIWTTTKKLYDSKGELKMRLPYGSRT